MQLDTRSEMTRLTNSANSTTAGTSIANPACTRVAPSGDGVIAVGSPIGTTAPNGVMLWPFGVGSATNTFLLSVFGWEHVPNPAVNGGVADLWVPWLMASFTCTLCTVAGLASTLVDNTNLFCGTITLNVGNAFVSNEIVSPTGNLVASILLDAKGVRYISTLYAMNGSSTSANALYRKV